MCQDFSMTKEMHRLPHRQYIPATPVTVSCTTVIHWKKIPYNDLQMQIEFHFDKRARTCFRLGLNEGLVKAFYGHGRLATGVSFA